MMIEAMNPLRDGRGAFKVSWLADPAAVTLGSQVMTSSACLARNMTISGVEVLERTNLSRAVLLIDKKSVISCPCGCLLPVGYLGNLSMVKHVSKSKR